MKITPYKERTLDESKPVHVYRNLGNAVKERYSIRQGGLVVGHADEITLADCEFKVSEAGRIRVLREGRKNVHAYIKGRIRESMSFEEWRPFIPEPHTEWEQFRYDPRTVGAFYILGKYGHHISIPLPRIIGRADVVQLESDCKAYGARR